MAKKSLKDMLADTSVLPDETIKGNIKAQLGYTDTPETTIEVELGGGIKGIAFISKKTLAIMATFFLAIALICAIVIPQLFKDTPFEGGGTTIDKFGDITTDGEFYSYGAASVASLISTETASMATKRLVKASKRSDSEQAIGKIKGYMPLVDGLIGENKITSTTEELVAVDSYDYKTTIGYPDVLGNYTYYVMYYNRVNVREEVDGDEVEQSYDIVGELIIDETSYFIRGEHESESEDGEEESELTFTAYKDGKPYLKLCQESENEEGESELGYEYTYFNEGVAVKRIRAEYEQEDGQRELKLTVIEGNVKDELVFEYDKKGDIYLKAKLNNLRYYYKVHHGDGGYEFEEIK